MNLTIIMASQVGLRLTAVAATGRTAIFQEEQAVGPTSQGQLEETAMAACFDEERQARTYEAQGDLALAVQHYKKAIKAFPYGNRQYYQQFKMTIWTLNFRVGVLYEELGIPQLALLHSGEAIRIRPDSPLPYPTLVTAHLRLGQYDEAVRQAEAGILCTEETVKEDRLPDEQVTNTLFYFLYNLKADAYQFLGDAVQEIEARAQADRYLP